MDFLPINCNVRIHYSELPITIWINQFCWSQIVCQIFLKTNQTPLWPLFRPSQPPSMTTCDPYDPFCPTKPNISQLGTLCITSNFYFLNFFTTNEPVCLYPGPKCGTWEALVNPQQKLTHLFFFTICAHDFYGFLLICKLFNYAKVNCFLMDFIWCFKKNAICIWVFCTFPTDVVHCW